MTETKVSTQVENTARHFVDATVAQYGVASALARARRITWEYPRKRQPQWLTRAIAIMTEMTERETNA